MKYSNAQFNNFFSRLFSYLSLAVFVSGLMSCATSPEGRKQLTLFPDAQMDAMGAQSFDQIKKKTPLTKNLNVKRYIECIANRIIPHVAQNPNPQKWEVQVFEDKQANAFALPGYKIGVYTGLLKYAKNQDQVAAVMGHEVAHVIAKHGNERISSQTAMQTGMSIAAVLLGASDKNNNSSLILAGLGIGAQYGVLLPFSRKHESEADLIGLDLIAKAGFNPAESVTLWQNMSQAGSAPPEFMSTHPSNSTRIKKLSARIPKANIAYQNAIKQNQRANCRL